MDGTRVQSGNYEKMAARLEGDAGTKVALVVRQNSEDTNMELTLRVYYPGALGKSKKEYMAEHGITEPFNDNISV